MEITGKEIILVTGNDRVNPSVERFRRRSTSVITPLSLPASSTTKRISALLLLSITTAS